MNKDSPIIGVAVGGLRYLTNLEGGGDMTNYMPARLIIGVVFNIYLKFEIAQSC